MTLTTKTAGALVAGAPTGKAGPVKLVVIEAGWRFNNKHVEVGQIIEDTNKTRALNLIRVGRCNFADEGVEVTPQPEEAQEVQPEPTQPESGDAGAVETSGADADDINAFQE